MSLGLVRHFKVEQRRPSKWLTAEQFNHWVEEYEAAPILSTGNTNSMRQWELCLCSDQARAVHTASFFAAKKYIYSEQLREIGVAAPPFRRFRFRCLRLPLTCWLVFGRLAFMAGHLSQPESKAAVQLRAGTVIDQLLAEAEAAAPAGHVLIVSHGAFMKVLDRELRHRGYKSKGRMGYPRNGQLFIYGK